VNILPIINNGKAKQSTTYGGALMALLEDHDFRVLSATADWLDIATQMKTQDGTPKVVARWLFSVESDCKLWHQQLYGNRGIYEFDKQGELVYGDNGPITRSPTPDEMKDQGVRFCASENLKYQEARFFAYDEDPDTHVVTLTLTNPDGSVQTSQVEADDLVYAGITFDYIEALKNLARVKACYDRSVALYEALTGKTFIYKPFERRQGGRAATPSQGMVALAASLRQRKV
jgi:hypothetical protein